jgi:hypothetical protein
VAASATRRSSPNIAERSASDNYAASINAMEAERQAKQAAQAPATLAN